MPIPPPPRVSDQPTHRPPIEKLGASIVHKNIKTDRKSKGREMPGLKPQSGQARISFIQKTTDFSGYLTQNDVIFVLILKMLLWVLFFFSEHLHEVVMCQLRADRDLWWQLHLARTSQLPRPNSLKAKALGLTKRVEGGKGVGGGPPWGRLCGPRRCSRGGSPRPGRFFVPSSAPQRGWGPVGVGEWCTSGLGQNFRLRGLMWNMTKCAFGVVIIVWIGVMIRWHMRSYNTNGARWAW